MLPVKRAVFVFAIISMYGASSYAVFNGQIRLKVVCGEKKPLEGVKVLIEHEDYGTGYERVTDKNGKVIQQAMPVGNYNTTFSKRGFQTVTGTIFIGGKDNRFMPGYPPECLISARNWKPRQWVMFKMIESEGGGEQLDAVIVQVKKRNIFDKGLEAFESNDFETARTEFERILEEKPELPDTYFLLYNTYLGLKESDKAFEVLRKGVELKPDVATAHRQLAGFYEKKGEDDVAIAAYEKSLELEPDSTYGNRDLGLLMLKKGQWQRASSLLARYLKLAPKASDEGRIKKILDDIDRYVE